MCPSDQVFVFDPLGNLGFKTFIKSNDEKIIDNFFEKNNNSDYHDGEGSIIRYKSIKFNAASYHNTMTKKLKKTLTPACEGLLDLFVEYSKANQNEVITCHFVRDQLQETYSYWCGIFVLFLLYNLFNPIADRISNKNKLCTMMHIKEVVDEIFNLGTPQGRQLNSIVLQNFIKEYGIKGSF